MSDNGGPVFFGLAGLMLVLLARWSVLVSLRPFYSKQRLAALDKPENRHLRRWVVVGTAINVAVGLFFVMAAILALV